MIIAIHQPDFMPWAGFFVKMMKSDIFVILDHTENNPRDAAFWGRRVRIAVNGAAHWFSVPLAKEDGRIGVPVKDMEISSDFAAQHAMKKTLVTFRQSYAKTPYYSQYSGLVEDYFSCSEMRLSARNVKFIRAVKDLLSIDSEILLSSSLGCSRSSTELLLEIVRAVDGSSYLSGDGANGYMDMALFARDGINVVFNGFVPPVYRQVNTRTFLPGLSIIDMLMNLGAPEAGRTLRSNLGGTNR